ncbi:MAG: ParB N-terminal domain-containing protein [Pyrinomonadaceae bacterium]
MATGKQSEIGVESIVSLPLDQLRFDPSNPRLPPKFDGEDEPAVLEWMLDDATIIELMNSIGENGYFEVEPLLVIRPHKGKDVFQVVEGNRRLAAVKLLNDPQLAPIKKQAVLEASKEAKIIPEELPSIVYPNRDSILYYLGYRHITGIKEWGPLAKARYLEQLRETLRGKSQEKQFEYLARTIGSNSYYVGRLLTGLSLYKEIADKDFYRLSGVNEQSIKFSLITTALTYSNIVQFLGLTSNTDPSLKRLVDRHLKELTSWMFEKGPENTTRLGESRNLKYLNAVVKNKTALTAFRNGASLNDATLLTGVPSEVFRLAIAKARVHLQNAREYIYKIKEATESDAEILVDIVDQASFLHRSLVNLLPQTQKHKTGTGKE